MLMDFYLSQYALSKENIDPLLNEINNQNLKKLFFKGRFIQFSFSCNVKQKVVIRNIYLGENNKM